MNKYNKMLGLKWIENGQVNLTGNILHLYNELDILFSKLASIVDAKAFRFPTFISAKELNKIDYFKSFPHLINFPVNLKQEETNIKKFIAGERCTQNGELRLTETNPICDCLTPAACYHFYIHFQNSTLDEVKYVTTLANCYRKEEYYLPLERQWNFTMREIVCLGTPDEVKDFLSKYKSIVTHLFDKLDLDVSWDVATDPFFDPASNPKFLMQTLDPVKHEMVLEKKLSIGSVNYHRTYFGDAFDIKRNNHPISTGCVAFGMERWLFAIISKYGENQNNWPKFDNILEKMS